MNQPSFLGDWLVSEYVYTPAGEYAGVIHQRRKLQPQGDVIRDPNLRTSKGCA